MRDPFLVSDLPFHFDYKEKLKFIEIITDASLQAALLKEKLADFWLRRRVTSPLLTHRELKRIIPFTTFYLCEQGFSPILQFFI